MDIGQVLRNAQQPDQQVRAQAEAQLEEVARDHYVPYLAMLTQALGGEDQPVEVRMLAALNLKNQLYAKDQRKRQFQTERWVALDQQAKAQIKQTALQVLVSSPPLVANASAQLIAAIADIELPRNEWQELTPMLVENTKLEKPTQVKRTSLLTIGYICENADPTNAGIAAHSDSILTAIIQGALAQEPDLQVRITALNALVNSLEFVRNNFEDEGERNMVMQVVCEATQSKEIELQAAAFGALGRIMNLYYHHMRSYMEQALFGLTVAGMESEDDQVACMAVEFWSTVCEEEIDIKYELEEYYNGTINEARTNHEFAQNAMGKILPTLLKLLTRQDDDASEDDWNVSMAAGACLQLFAQNTGNYVVQPTLDFVSANIQSQKWQEREAAVMAFGSIMDGPDPNQLKTLISQALPPLLNLMNDSSLQVKDTVAWCIGRMADLVIDGINIETDLPNIIQALLQGLRDHPRVSTNCCWTVMNLVEQLAHDGPDAQTSPMSQYYEPLVQSLLQSASRNDNEHSCRTSAYEALSSMVTFSTQDVVGFVERLSAEVLQRLEQTLTIQQQIVGNDDRAQVEELQNNLLGLLTNIIRRVEGDVANASDQLMSLLLQLLDNRLPNSLIEEDVFIAIGAVAGAVGEGFDKYMSAFSRYLHTALEDTESQTCSTAVGLVADICHALGPNVRPYTDGFMQTFLTNLKKDVSRELKPVILSCIGDVASTVGHNGFTQYIGPVMEVLDEASRVHANIESSVEFIEYVDRLHESILDAFVGIVAGLRETPDQLAPYIGPMFGFLRQVGQNPEYSNTEAIARSEVGLLGDIASMYPPGQLRDYYEDWTVDLIRRTRANTSFSATTRDTARWAREQQKKQV